MTLSIQSPAFAEGEAMPVQYTSDGENVSPPLQWTNVPERTKSLALIVEDPDAPDPRRPKVTWVHWVLFDLPPDSQGLPENATKSKLPPGTKEGQNDWQKTGYGGPDPPIGKHRYYFRLYALDTTLSELDAPTKPDLIAAMQDHVLAEASCMGTYEKP